MATDAPDAKTAPAAPEESKKDAPDGAEKVGEEEEEEEECGFCRFMKGGSCKAAFVAWEECVDAAKDAKDDFVEKCAKQTEALRDCMMADPGYYGDMLPDEKEDEGGKDGAAADADDEKRGAEDEPEADAPAPMRESRAAAAVRGR